MKIGGMKVHRTFTKIDFEIFQLVSLEERMAAIRERIQPVFQEIGNTYAPIVAEKTKYEANFHIAQHRRRTTNPPESTWSAIGGNARGYKNYPHVQVGINDEHIFIFVSIIDNPIFEKEMGRSLLEYRKNWNQLPDDFVISGDHTKSKVEDLNEENAVRLINRLLTVKKSEVLIGRTISSDDSILEDKVKQRKFFEETIESLVPLYKQLLDIHYAYEK